MGDSVQHHNVQKVNKVWTGAGSPTEIADAKPVSVLIEASNLICGLNERITKASTEYRVRMDQLIGSEPSPEDDEETTPPPCTDLERLNRTIGLLDECVATLEHQLGRLSMLTGE